MEFLFNNSNITIQDSVIELIEKNKQLTVLSPYLTRNKAIESILNKENFKLTLILNLECDLILAKAIDLKIVSRLLDKNHNIYSHKKLHSKIYITDDTVIIGSSNFTNSGLAQKQESCIKFSREFESNAFKDCESYCKRIKSESEIITKKRLDEIIKLVEDENKSEEIKEEELDEILGNQKLFSRIEEAYELMYNYPKNLADLDPSIKFEYVDFDQIEKEYKNQFSGKGRNKSKLINYIQESLYIKNKGYGMKTKIHDRKTPAIYLWYLRNINEFPFPLKQYSDFYKDRGLELLKLYKSKYNIQPISGFLSRHFEYLKINNLISDDYFEIKYNKFDKEYRFNKIKNKVEEIDAFFTEKKVIPSRNARLEISNKKKNGTLNLDEELKLRDEERLRDWLYNISNKYRNSHLDLEQKNYLDSYFEKWNWEGIN